MRIPYTAYPAGESDAKLGKKFVWWPVIKVRLVDRKLQVKTKYFQAVVDSGSDDCYFHADALKPFGITLTDGIESTLGGVGRNTAIPVYYHDVYILVGVDWKICVRAGFSNELSVAGILGRTGFFDHFRLLFDHTDVPPVLEIHKIERKNVN